jgi:hypothetical protein
LATSKVRLDAQVETRIYGWLPIMLGGGWLVFVLAAERRGVVAGCCA